MEDLSELMFREEPLRKELEPYIFDGPVGRKMIHHPLLIELFFDPERSALVNKRYEYKIEAIAAAKKKGNWEDYIWLHERPYRLEALVYALKRKLNNAAELVASAWIDSENIRENSNTWLKVWKSLAKPNDTMDEDELEALAAMPEVITVYRGIREPHHNPRGMSWTIDREKAIWFAKRWNGKRPTLITGEIKKEKVLACFTGRGEKEIVAMPKDVKVLKKERL